jgi:acyl-coenzyme A synthetase/AMP-(fatty) acid ligase/aryl carrier-like protein
MNHDSPQMAAALAVLLAGGVVVAMNPGEPLPRLRHIRDESSARLLLCDAANRADAACLAAEVRVDALLLEDSGELTPLQGKMALGGATSLPEVAPDQLAFLVYTSGSTGLPKAVMQTHANIIDNVRRQSIAMALRSSDHVVMTAHLGSGQGLATWASALLNAALLHPFPVMETGFSGLEAYLLEQRPSVLVAPGSVFRRFAKTLGRDLRLPSIRILRLASERLIAEDVRAFRRHGSPDAVLFHTYSASETGNLTHVIFRNKDPFPALLHVGRPADGMCLRVLGADGQEADAREGGEIVVSSPFLSPGYWNHPELTRERFFRESGGVWSYRTGDWGRMTAQGDWVLEGRRDHELKVHGYRVNTFSIARTLEEIPGVAEAVVGSRLQGEDAVLEAYAVLHAEGEADAASLRVALAGRLPRHLIPGVIRIVDAIPLNPNGKCDWEQLRALPFRGSDEALADGAAHGFANASEQQLARLWETELGVKDLHRESDFFSLGGDSLHAVVLVAMIERERGLRVGIKELFSRPVLNDFAAYLDALQGHPAAAQNRGMLRLPRDRALPMSHTQEALWRLDQGTEKGDGWTVACLHRISGPLKVDLLQACFKDLLERHEILRTTFDEVDGQAVQIIHPVDPERMPVEIRDAPLEDEAAALELLRELSCKAFNLRTGPLVRWVLVWTRDPSCFLMRLNHHIISDGWSWKVLFRELGLLYEARLEGRLHDFGDEGRPQYADFAAWERQFLGPDLAHHEDKVLHWMQRLGKDAQPTPPPLPAAGRSSKPCPADGRLRWGVPGNLSGRIDDWARQEGFTYYCVRLAVFAMLLGRKSKQKLLIGSYTSNRNALETQSMFGFFANTVILPLDYDPVLPFPDWVRRVQDTVLESQSIAFIPIEVLRKRMREMGGRLPKPLVRFSVLDNTYAMEFGGLTVEWRNRVGGAMPYGFSFRVNRFHEDSLSGLFFDASRHDPKAALRFITVYQELLAEVASAPDARLVDLVRRVRGIPRAPSKTWRHIENIRSRGRSAFSRARTALSVRLRKR